MGEMKEFACEDPNARFWVRLVQQDPDNPVVLSEREKEAAVAKDQGIFDLLTFEGIKSHFKKKQEWTVFYYPNQEYQYGWSVSPLHAEASWNVNTISRSNDSLT